MESDKLTEIPREDWEDLRDLYKKNWPDNKIAYFVVDNYIQWANKSVDIRKDLQVLCLNGTWRENGTYLILDRYEIFIYSIEESNDTLKRALRLIDWNRSTILSSFVHKNRAAVDDVIKHKNLNIEYDYLTFAYHLSKEEALELDIDLPEGLYLKQLDASHSRRVDDLWPHQCEGSEMLVTRLIEWNINLGLFDGNDDLLAWCLRDQTGAHAMLQCEEGYKRMGYATILTKAMAKVLAECGYDSHASVLVENIASSKTFQKVGFKNVGYIYWMSIIPTNENENKNSNHV